jgi:hypothetical protein
MMLDAIRKAYRNAANVLLDVAYGKAKEAVRTGTGDQPPLMLHEVDSHYMGRYDPTRKNRYIVSLIVGYDPATSGAKSPEDAAALALDLTRDENSRGTCWCVYDRVTRQMHYFDQGTFDPREEDAPQEIDRLIEETRREVEKESVWALKELSRMIVDTARKMWGEASEALKDDTVDLAQIPDQPPGTRAMLALYRTAKDIYNAITDVEINEEILDSASDPEERAKFASLMRALKKIELDEKDLAEE